ncbi:MAG: SpoIID/LytB domain-containing protein [Candidatus Dependentiae bacterium]|nr:SpoIID/LytB domain-containing protein [Candidatus Dependentiae bacterium]
MIRCATRRWCSLFLAIIFLLGLGGLSIWAETVAGGGRDSEYHFDVRVLLAKELVNRAYLSKAAPGSAASELWLLSSPEGFTATDRQNGITEKLGDTTIAIGVRAGRLTINGRRLRANNIELVPISGATAFGKYRYAGTMHVMLDPNGEIFLVNRLDVEDYVFSVIRWESVPGWPIEANKAMAIACRTYLVHMVLSARRERTGKTYHYDLGATNLHQTYRGLHEFDDLRIPVDETRGVIMAWRDVPEGKLRVVLALYDACCGASNPSKMGGVINLKNQPCLGRDKVCRFCQKCKLFKWHKSYTRAEFETLIRESCPALFRDKRTRVTDARVSKRDESRVVHRMQVKVGGTWYSLTGEQAYGIFRGIKSRMFTIKSDGRTITFRGRGYGHGLGLCQWGAYRQAKLGWDCYEILAFYYTDAILFTTVRATGS